MPTTPKALRAAPARTFENYTFNRVVGGSDADLLPVSFNAFKRFAQGPTSENVGNGFADDALSSATPIGFDFTFDGFTYKQFVACTNGWLALVDPTTGTFTPTDMMLSSFWDPGGISSTQTTKSVLLAPWFDDLVNVANDMTQLSGSYGATKSLRVRSGLEPPVLELNNVKYGVRYYNGTSAKGRYLVVRWHSLSNVAVHNSLLAFDAVIYENGDIEFRYAPRTRLTLRNNGVGLQDGATCGIFASGSNRFRDFSAGLGYSESSRQPYKYGGFTYSPAFSNTSISGHAVPFSVNLTPFNNWPGTVAAATAMVFQAPKLRRQVLPRVAIGEQDARISMPLVGRTGDTNRLGTRSTGFDDRLSVPFRSGSVVVNYPTTLPRLFGGSERGAALRQDLFTGDMEITASIVNSAADPFLIERPKTYIKPFSENKQYEQVTNNVNGYYASGSSLYQFDSLDQRLQSKTQLRMSFPVERSIVLPTGSACTVYYRPSSRSWAVPSNASYIISPTGSTNDSGVAKGDIRLPTVDFVAGRFLAEDFKAFGPIGNRISSGTLPNASSVGQTDQYINEIFDRTRLIPEISKKYGKSVSVNQDYSATQDEVFSLPVAKPFLLEKAVIEIPFAMGDGWFKNLTTTFVPIPSNEMYADGGFDFSGPALTFALYNQIKAGSGTRLDLIMSGTITHAIDNQKFVLTNLNSPADTGVVYMCRPVGYLAYDKSPGAIVTPLSTSKGYVFTGSVKLHSVAAVSAGSIPVTIYTTIVEDFTFGKASGIRQVLSSPTIGAFDSSVHLSYNQFTYSTSHINPLSRGASGFHTSVRSAFGKEYVAFDGSFWNPGIANPFYFTGSNANQTGTASGLPTQLELALQDVEAGTKYMKLMAALPFIKHMPSPYIVNPGDKLVLAISKARPVLYNANSSLYMSGGIGDDVQLITGSIDVTFYGSELSQNTEQHDVLNQPLASTAVHELFVGGNPTIVDQFEGDYHDAYSGSFNDVVVGGSMLQTLTWNGLGTGSLGRGVLFSKSAPRSASYQPGVGPYDQSYSYSYRIQPFYERAGTVRTLSLYSTTERIWDSCMPAIDQCLQADGNGIYVYDAQYVGGTQIDQNVWTTTGFMNLNTVGQWILAVQAQLAPILNVNWSWAYPFEPRYSDAARQLDISKSFNATYSFALVLGTPTISAIPPRAVGSVIPVVTSNSPLINRPTYWIDADLSAQVNGFYVSGSLSLNDAIRTIYGYGDLNTVINLFGPGYQEGGNNYPSPRTYDKAIGNSSTLFFSPQIRGWKYGVWSGFPTFTKANWRVGRFGQFRDMLEQRVYTKLFILNDPALPSTSTQQGETVGVVAVKFIDKFGNLTKPENTWSFNLSSEATSSMPYFDGLAVNRPAINTNTLNVGVLNVAPGPFGNISL